MTSEKGEVREAAVHPNGSAAATMLTRRKALSTGRHREDRGFCLCGGDGGGLLLDSSRVGTPAHGGLPVAREALGLLTSGNAACRWPARREPTREPYGLRWLLPAVPGQQVAPSRGTTRTLGTRTLHDKSKPCPPPAVHTTRSCRYCYRLASHRCGFTLDILVVMPIDGHASVRPGAVWGRMS
jgi:hypothetical protein